MKNTLSIIKHSIILSCSLVYYFLTGKPTVRGYNSLIVLFCKTSGRSSDLLAKFVSCFHRSHNKNVKSKVFGDYDALEIKKISDRIVDDGYVILDRKLSDECIEKIFELTHRLKANITASDMFMGDSVDEQNILFDKNNLKSVRYTYSEEDILKSEIIQQILADSFLPAVCESYLKAEPILDSVHLSWSTNYSKVADEKAAQKFHFDMERIKWLKVFIYLTDTDYTSGPHCFIKGSHKANGIPDELLRRGYARIEDREAEQFYDKERLLEFVGKRGTIIIEDTRGLHKGKNLSGDPRLMLQLEFANSLYGCLSKKKLKDVKFSQDVLNNKKNYPKLLNQFT